MIIFELTTEMAIPKGFSSTRAHKQWRGLYDVLAFNPASSFGAV